MTESEARIELFLKYIRGYGPASLQDFIHWTGLPAADAREALEGARDRLVEVRITGGKGSYWLPDGTPIPGRSRGTARGPSVRFLPEFDPLVMGHKDKTRFMNERERKRIFLPLAAVAPVFLIDGRVAGVWDLKMEDRDLTLSPFASLSERESMDVHREAKRLRDFIGHKQQRG
jgi:hypothetical protein